jgi:hypothetical protein
MKAILEFNLPEDHEQYEDAINGRKWLRVCLELEQHLRGKTKHSPDSMSAEEYKALKDTREFLHRLLDAYDLTLR